MRLTTFEINSIIKVFEEVFKEGDIYLFGSRVDDTKKGGDIDLFLDLPYAVSTKNSLEKKNKFLIKLYDTIGEQKIDVVISKDKERSIEQEALRNGIMLNGDNLKLDKYINECEKHLIRIEKSYNKVHGIFPISAKRYKVLNDDEIEAIDQYLFRFAKLQDTMGEKIFRVIVSQYVEGIDKLAFIDILNHLEKIGILENANDWKLLRSIRNEISHQYDDEAEEMAEALNNMFANKDLLLSIYIRVKSFYEKTLR